MKRILAAGLMLAVLTGAPCALAESAAQIAAQTGMASEEGESIAAMTVVNCDEWVSLRAADSTSSKQLAKVPLGATVTDCTYVSDDFVHCCYGGQWGFILAGYLSEESGSIGEYLGDMIIVDCNAWVSLRAQPSTSASRLSTIPLGAIVTNCTRASGGFIYCEYQWMSGYVLAEYLEVFSEPQTAFGKPFLEQAVGDYTIRAYRDYFANGEMVYVECVDAEGAQVWTYYSDVPFATELDGTDAFIGGTAEDPRVMVFNVNEGLFSLDAFSGEMRCYMPKEHLDLGGGISAAVAEDGTMYIGGYYGPDPVAISVDGEVLWRAEPGHDAYWLYEIEVTDAGVVATYDCIDEHEAAGQITYGFDGSVISVEWF